MQRSQTAMYYLLLERATWVIASVSFDPKIKSAVKVTVEGPLTLHEILLFLVKFVHDDVVTGDIEQCLTF